MKAFTRIVMACAAFAVTGSLQAAATVTVGSPAPALVNADYVQGEAVKKFDSDHAYLVEFWATWCGPCIASIPHVDALQKKYADKGFVVIGQNVWERDTKLVDPFLKKMKDKMTYRVAMDDTSDGGKGKMATDWLAAAGRNGIPCAFLIGKDQKIAWIGHPMQLKDEVIEGVLAGTFDVAGAAKAYAEESSNQEKSSSLLKSIRAHITAKEWDEASKEIDTLAPLVASKSAYTADLLRLELNTKKGDLPAATEVTRKIAKENAANLGLIGHACTLLATAAKDDKATLESADKILTDAAASQPKKDMQVLMAQAKVKKALGKDAEAATFAKDAVDSAPENSKAAVKRMLKGLLPADAE